MKFKAVFFDIDGTLISVYSVTRCLKKAFEHFGVKVTSLKKMAHKSMGYKVEEIVQREFPELKGKTKEFSSYYENFYVKNYKKYTKLLPFVKSIFRFLNKKKIKIGIITSKSRKTALVILKGFNLKYDVLVSSDDVKNRKPHSEPVLKACKLLGVKPEECIFFGDHSFDMKAAKAAECKAVGVLTGVVKRKELKKSGADFIIKNLKEAKILIE
jgi:pyrophosphatase PpaX